MLNKGAATTKAQADLQHELSITTNISSSENHPYQIHNLSSAVGNKVKIKNSPCDIVFVDGLVTIQFKDTSFVGQKPLEQQIFSKPKICF